MQKSFRKINVFGPESGNTFIYEASEVLHLSSLDGPVASDGLKEYRTQSGDAVNFENGVFVVVKTGERLKAI